MGEMQDQSDAQLLRAYAERGTEAAFAEIVTRHTDLIYSAALRQVHSPDLARDVTQSVFTDLARKAREVSRQSQSGASLVGWLYRGTRFAARDLNRGEIRRTQRERQAMEQVHPTPDAAPDWEQLRPALDDAMAELDDTDRDAVLLRYFKNHDLRTVGATLGISDDAAQKRVSRAVERLREFLAKRGVTIGASGLVVAVAANAVQAAPAGLALTISTAAALTGTSLATTSVATATKAIAMTTLQKTLATATLAVLASAGIYVAHQDSQLRQQIEELQRKQAPMAEQMEQANQERDEAKQELFTLQGEHERLNQTSEELLKLRSEFTQLQTQLDAIQRQGRKLGNQFGVPPEQSPPIVGSSVTEMAWAYGQLRRKTALGVELISAEEVHLAKAWPYVRQFTEPEPFALFQATYMGVVLDWREETMVWQVRGILERARKKENYKGMHHGRPSISLGAQMPPAAPKVERYKEDWEALDRQTRQEIKKLLSTDQQRRLDANFSTVLDFDEALTTDPARAQDNPKFKGLTNEQVSEAWPRKPGAVWGVVGTYPSDHK